jgi:hypothetical protein
MRDLYMGINEFKKGYQSRTYLEKDGKGNLLVDPHKIVNRWMNYICQLLNVQREGGIRLTEIQIAEPFVPEPNIYEVVVAFGKLKRYKSSGADYIPGELFQAVGGTLHSEIDKLIKLNWNKEELPHKWKESIVVPIYKMGDKTECSNYRGISMLLTSYKILSNMLLSRLITYADEIIGDHQCGF